MDAVNNVAFPRQDARTLADDGNALRLPDGKSGRLIADWRIHALRQQR